MSSNRQYRVLVTDDEPLLVDLTRFWFEHHGIGVDCAANGLEAQALLREQRYDLLMLDLMMPGLNGKELLQWLRGEQQDQVPVIITTGLNKPGLADELSELGANRLLIKPVHLDALEAAVQEFIHF